MDDRAEIEFSGHDGTTLRGWWYTPKASGRGAAIVMAHGFSAVKEMALGRYAEVFHGAGLGVLLYDHRNFGASEGEPRQEIDPWGQVRDYRSAISWVTKQSDVDDRRIGTWGTSFSGGAVIILAACDRRVRAAAVNVPLAGLAGSDYADTRDRYAAIRQWVMGAPSESSPAEAVLGPFAVVEQAGVESPAYLPQSESSDWFLQYADMPGSSWQNRVTLRNAFAGDPPYDPGACIEHVAPTPLLMVVAEDDRVADAQIALRAFDRAREPKQLEVVAGHHFATYEGPALQRASDVARDFFLTHL